MRRGGKANSNYKIAVGASRSISIVQLNTLLCVHHQTRGRECEAFGSGEADSTKARRPRSLFVAAQAELYRFKACFYVKTDTCPYPCREINVSAWEKPRRNDQKNLRYTPLHLSEGFAYISLFLSAPLWREAARRKGGVCSHT